MEMATRTKPWLVLSLVLFAANCMQQCVHGESQAPCVFVYGDSQSDNGNNNNLWTSAKANYTPYGIDFPAGPTGRFSNGQNAVDFTTQLLGFANFIPPYANNSGSDILKGANYASGASGIRPQTGKHLGDNIELRRQFTNHRNMYWRIVTRLRGRNKAEEYLGKCLYYVNIGSNDYINNYFLPQIYPTSRVYNLDQYAQDLVARLSTFLQGLRRYGARKFVVFGCGLIGCTPNAISKRGINGNCVQEYNQAAFIFNAKLKPLIDQLNNNYSPGSKFVFINSTEGTLDSSLGFTVINAACCQTMENGQCIPNTTPCENRREHVFYDEFHLTSAANNFSALGSIAKILTLFQS